MEVQSTRNCLIVLYILNNHQIIESFGRKIVQLSQAKLCFKKAGEIQTFCPPTLSSFSMIFSAQTLWKPQWHMNSVAVIHRSI